MQSSMPMLSNTDQRVVRAYGDAIGTIFLSLFGLAWILLALASLGQLHAYLVVLLSCFVAILLASSISVLRRTHLLVREQKKSPHGKHINRMFGLVNVIQWTVIFLAVDLLGHFHLGHWIVPTIIMIVGIHFLPLAYLFQARLHYVTGCALVLWAVAAPLLVPSYAMEAIAALGTGAILWLTAVKQTMGSLRLSRGLHPTMATK
ncbi:MAG: hypothetical protein ACP5EP_10290 [Acidobacteriaceae bacterium]